MSTPRQQSELVYVSIAPSSLHDQHLDIIQTAACHGRVIVGLLTEISLGSSHQVSMLTWEEHKRIFQSIKGVDLVVPQTSLDCRQNLRMLRPECLVCEAGLKTETIAQLRECLNEWGGSLIESGPKLRTPRNQFNEKLQIGNEKIVFVPMCCDFVHIGHMNVLNASQNLGSVTVLLMTDDAMRQYKRDPAMPYEHRKRIIQSMRQVKAVMPCHGPEQYAPLVRRYRPDYFVHGDDWKTGPQQQARGEVLRACRGYGGEVVEPAYTPVVSSTQSQKDFSSSLENSHHVGLLIRTVLNDTKRDVEVAARETKLGKQALNRLLAGHELDELSKESAIRILSRFYPIPKRQMMIDEDTSDKGAWFMTAAQTENTQRIFNRTNANGDTTPYYKYMDTATSALSPFKPELIEELVQVDDNNPMNPLVVMNRGHLLGQATFFIGPVNFYWTVRGKRKCKVMNTGDTCLITSYVPHSFASRDLSQYTAIVAVTFAGTVREALPQLLHLQSKALCEYSGDLRNPESVRTARILRFAELRGMDEPMVRSTLSSKGLTPSELDDIFAGRVVKGAPKALAEVLNVPASEFLADELKPENEVTFQAAPTSDKPGKYAIASVSHMHDIGGFEWRLGTDPETEISQFYRYIYNFGVVPVNIEWKEIHAEKGSAVQQLAPGDSVVFKPFISTTFTPTDEGASLIVFKVPGCVTSEVMKELATFAAEGRNRMSTAAVRWY